MTDSTTDNQESNSLTISSSSTCFGKQNSGNNAFSFLMSSLKETEIWKENAVSKDRTSRAQKAQGNRRKAPFYKVLQGMPIAVDAFNYGKIPDVTAYFLTFVSQENVLWNNTNSSPKSCSLRSLYKPVISLEKWTDILLTRNC